MFTEKVQTIGFFVILAAVGLVAAFIFWPFAQIIAFAGILAVLFRPLYLKVSGNFKSQNLAALTTVIMALAIVVVPLSLIGYALFHQISNFYSTVKNGSVNLDQDIIVSNLPQSLQAIGQSFFADLSMRISSIAGSTIQGATSVLSNVANFFLGIFLVFFTLYYFLVDGDRIKKFLGSVFPLSDAHESKLMEKLELAISGVVKGQLLMAIIQGSIATVGFLIFGVPQPFLWGTFTVMAALIPTFGTSLALIPAVLYLLLTGHTGAGIGMAIWGATAVGLIDNFVGPKIIGSRTNLHPLLVLFAVLGGVQFFGFLGFLLGPILMAVFITLLDIYRGELK